MAAVVSSTTLSQVPRALKQAARFEKKIGSGLQRMALEYRSIARL